MLAAAERSNDKDNPNQVTDYQLYKFYFATGLLHETGHVFITYLSKGREDTPVSAGPVDVWAPKRDGKERGEAGYNLEYKLYAGRVKWYRHPSKSDDDRQVC